MYTHTLCACIDLHGYRIPTAIYWAEASDVLCYGCAINIQFLDSELFPEALPVSSWHFPPCLSPWTVSASSGSPGCQSTAEVSKQPELNGQIAEAGRAETLPAR